VEIRCFGPLNAVHGTLCSDPSLQSSVRDPRGARAPQTPRAKPRRGRTGPRRPSAGFGRGAFGECRASSGCRRRRRASRRSFTMSIRPAERSDGDRSTRNAAFGPETNRLGAAGPKPALARRYPSTHQLQSLGGHEPYAHRLRVHPDHRLRPEPHRGARFRVSVAQAPRIDRVSANATAGTQKWFATAWPIYQPTRKRLRCRLLPVRACWSPGPSPPGLGRRSRSQPRAPARRAHAMKLCRASHPR